MTAAWRQSQQRSQSSALRQLQAFVQRLLRGELGHHLHMMVERWMEAKRRHLMHSIGVQAASAATITLGGEVDAMKKEIEQLKGGGWRTAGGARPGS